MPSNNMTGMRDQQAAAAAQHDPSDPRYLHRLQRTLNVLPTGRQTFETGHEPMADVYRAASAELFGTTVIVVGGGFSIMAVGEAMHAHAGAYPYDIARTNEPAGNALAELGPAGVLAVAVAVSSIITMLVFLFSRVSGGHFNCAVTLSFMMRKRISSKRGVVYMIAQFLGSFLGGILLKVFVPGAAESCLGAPSLGAETSVWSALFLEFFFALVLILVYLTRMTPGPAGRQLAHPFKVELDDDPGGNGGAMVGAVYLAAHISLLPFTGASLNPTRSFGPQMFSNLDCDSFTHVWMYWAAPCIAAVVGPILHDLWFPPVGAVDDVRAQPPASRAQAPASPP